MFVCHFSRKYEKMFAYHTCGGGRGSGSYKPKILLQKITDGGKIERVGSGMKDKCKICIFIDESNKQFIVTKMEKGFYKAFKVFSFKDTRITFEINKENKSFGNANGKTHINIVSRNNGDIEVFIKGVKQKATSFDDMDIKWNESITPKFPKDL